MVIAVVGEGVEQGLQVAEGAGLGGLGAQQLLHRGFEAFDLALGVGVVGSTVLDDAAGAQFVLERGASAAVSVAGQAHGVVQAVVGQGRGRVAVLVRSTAKAVDYNRSGIAAREWGERERRSRAEPPGAPYDLKYSQDVGSSGAIEQASTYTIVNADVMDNSGLDRDTLCQ
nr:hypothetical protein [Cellulosimicrobium sp. Marseille-Q4280]